MCMYAYDIMNCTGYICEISPQTSSNRYVDILPASVNNLKVSSKGENGMFPSAICTIDAEDIVYSDKQECDCCKELQVDYVLSSSTKTYTGLCNLRKFFKKNQGFHKKFCLFFTCNKCSTSYQATPFNLHPILLLILYMLYAFLTACIYFGWGSLSELLFKSGAFEWRCDNIETSDREILNKINGFNGKPFLCDNQDAAVQPLFTVCMACHSIMTAFAGALLDECGPKITALLGQTLNTAAWLLLAFSSRYFVAYYPAFIFMGFGADTGYIPTLSIAHLFPQNFSLVITLMGASSTASFAVPLILEHIWNRFPNLVFRDLCLLYIVFGTLPCGILAVFFMPKKCFTSTKRRKLRNGEFECNFQESEGKNENMLCKKETLDETDSQKDTSTFANSQNDVSDRAIIAKEVDLSLSSFINNYKIFSSLLSYREAVYRSAIPYDNDVFSLYSSCDTFKELSCGDNFKNLQNTFYHNKDHLFLSSFVDVGYQLNSNRRHSSPACLCYTAICYDRIFLCQNKQNCFINFYKNVFLLNRKSASIEGIRNDSKSILVEFKKQKPPLEEVENGNMGPVKDESISLCVSTAGVNLYSNKMHVDTCTDSFWKQFYTRQFLAIAVISSVVQISISFYQSSYSRSFSMSVAKMMEIILPFSFIPCIIFGKLIDSLGIIPIMSLVNTAGVLAYIFSLSSYESMHYASIFVFCVYISVDSDIVFSYVGYNFSSRHFGKLCGVAIALGGVSSFMSYPLYDHLTVRYLNGNTTPVKIIILILLCLMYCIHAYLWWWKRRLKTKISDEIRL